MDNLLKIQHRGIEAGTIEVGSSVVVESFDENWLCLRVPQTAAAAEEARGLTKAETQALEDTEGLGGVETTGKKRKGTT